MSIFNSNVEFERHSTLSRRTGLPDSPELERQVAAEMAEAFGYDDEPSSEEIDAMAEFHHARHGAGDAPAGYADTRCGECGAAIFVEHGAPAICTRCQRHPTSPAPAISAAVMFPEVVTWSDEHLITAIDLCERRDPALKLHAVGDVPDRHEQFLDECSAELVRRLDARCVNLAA